LELPLSFRKKLLRGKDSLLRNDHLELGFICVSSPQKLVSSVVNLYFTSMVRLRRFKTFVSSPSIPVQTKSLDLEDMPPNKQYKQSIEFGLPTTTNLAVDARPVLQIMYTDDAWKDYEETVPLPFSVLRVAKYEGISDQSKFIAAFRDIDRLVMVAGPIRYSNHILP